MKDYAVKLTAEEQTILLAYKQIKGGDISVSLAFGMALRELRDNSSELESLYALRWSQRLKKVNHPSEIQ